MNEHFRICQPENSNCDAVIADQQLPLAPCFVAGKVQIFLELSIS
jgi:hypothetical protein